MNLSFLEVLSEKSSISFLLVVPYIGFKQQSSSCTSPLLQYLATTAKRGLLFISMLLSRSYAENIRCFYAAVCCSVTLVAISVIRLSTVRGETGISLILEISVHLFGESSNNTSAQLIKASFTNNLSINGFRCLAMPSAIL